MQIMKLLVAALLMVATTAMGDSPTPVTPDAKIQPALAKAFEGKSESSRVRAIVSLEADQPAGLDRAAAIAAAQDRVIGAFKAENNGAGLAVLARYRTLFGFSAELNRGQVTALARRGDVTFIEEMPAHEKLWPESHPLTDVDLAQQAGYADHAMHHVAQLMLQNVQIIDRRECRRNGNRFSPHFSPPFTPQNRPPRGGVGQGARCPDPPQL